MPGMLFKSYSLKLHEVLLLNLGIFYKCECVIWPAKKFWPFQHNFVRNATTQDGFWCWVYLYRVFKSHIFPFGAKIEKIWETKIQFIVVLECLNFVGYLPPCCLLLYLWIIWQLCFFFFFLIRVLLKFMPMLLKLCVP